MHLKTHVNYSALIERLRRAVLATVSSGTIPLVLHKSYGLLMNKDMYAPLR
jgi:hypothetical protein